MKGYLFCEPVPRHEEQDNIESYFRHIVPSEAATTLVIYGLQKLTKYETATMSNLLKFNPSISKIVVLGPDITDGARDQIYGVQKALSKNRTVDVDLFIK